MLNIENIVKPLLNNINYNTNNVKNIEILKKY